MSPIRAGYGCCLAFAVLLASLSAAAQEAAPTSSGDRSEPESPRRDPGAPPLTFEVPQGWLESNQQNDDAKPPLPSYGITELLFNGRVVGGRAELEATLSVRVLREGWIQVPLRMDEALALRLVRDERGQTPIVIPSEEEGRIWWVEGIDKLEPADNGERHLRLKLTLPIQTLSGEQALMLSLPDAVPSELQLDVPLNELEVRYGNDRAAVKANPVGEGKTRITAGGLGERLELYWRPKAKAAG